MCNYTFIKTEIYIFIDNVKCNRNLQAFCWDIVFRTRIYLLWNLDFLLRKMVKSCFCFFPALKTRSCGCYKMTGDHRKWSAVVDEYSYRYLGITPGGVLMYSTAGEWLVGSPRQTAMCSMACHQGWGLAFHPACRGTRRREPQGIRYTTGRQLHGLVCINALRPEQNGRHLAGDVFTCIFLSEDVLIKFKFHCNLLISGNQQQVSIASGKSLVPSAFRHYLNGCWSSYMTPYGVILPR